jgi:hypothetical protein
MKTLTRLQILTLLILVTTFSQIVFGQVIQPEKELNVYLAQLKEKNIDTVLVVNSGCVGCEVTYNNDQTAIPNGKSIYVLTKHKGQFNLAIFDDIQSKKSCIVDTCTIFEFILKNKAILQQKDIFYKSEMNKIRSKNGFYPPRPVHYSYEELNIQLVSFNYVFNVVDHENDNFGLNREKDSWFILTKEIIGRVYSILKSVNS